MKSVITIAGTSVRELVRQRVVLAIAGVAFALALLSLLLGELTIEEQDRMIADFSLFATEAAAIALALTLGATTLSREIDRQTCLLVLARPLTRFQFLMGKWLGAAGVQLIVVAVLSLTMSLLLGHFWPTLPLLAVSIWLKSLVILSWTLAASNVIRPLLAFMFGFVLYLLGHWLGDLEFFARKSPELLELVRHLRWIVPSFDLYNWKDHFHLVESPSFRETMGMIAQTLAWTGLGLGAAGWAFGRRDIV